jgi:hypothetical protein
LPHHGSLIKVRHIQPISLKAHGKEHVTKLRRHSSHPTLKYIDSRNCNLNTVSTS